MSRGINKVILIGNLGANPDVKTMQSGEVCVSLSVATNEQWKDKNTGETKSKTEWHRVTIYGKLAEIAGEYLSKGSSVYLDGKLRHRHWKDDSGKDVYMTDVVAKSMQMLGGGSNKPNQASTPAPPQTNNNDFDDDIPF